jgi:hypothetical protein
MMLGERRRRRMGVVGDKIRMMRRMMHEIDA